MLCITSEMMASKRNNTFINLNFKILITISCILPLAGMFLCQAICLMFFFKQSTNTSCDHIENVNNFLPSISEATGKLPPQKYIWRICIALHCTPRFLIAAGYHNMHKIMFFADKNMNIYRHLANAAYTFHLVEILALIGLSFVSSSEDYEIHKFCFMTFMLCAIVNMISMCILHGVGKKAVKFNLSREEKSSLKYKLIMFIINAVFFSAALYFFHRHSVYCEEGVYSLFAICEIIVVLTNAGFHATAIIDFHNSHLVLTDFSEK